MKHQFISSYPYHIYIYTYDCLNFQKVLNNNMNYTTTPTCNDK